MLILIWEWETVKTGEAEAFKQNELFGLEYII